MSDAKVSDLTELAATPAADDELVVVDKSDTTQAASGTTKRLRADRLYSMPGNVTLGDDASDTLTVNAGTWTLGSNYVSTRAAGALAAGTTTLQEHLATFSGDAGGTTDGRGFRMGVTASGANVLAGARVFSAGLTLSTSAGATTNARANFGNVTLDGAGTATNASIFEGAYTLSSSGGITSANYFVATTPSLSSTGAITTLAGFRSQNLGHATLVDSAYGFLANDMTAAVTTSAGFASAMTSGTGKWAFLSTGTANNAFAGNTRIGSTVAPTETLDVTGSAAVSGDMTIGDASGDTLTVNAGTWTLGSNYVATRAAGALAAGSTTLESDVVTFSGDAGGSTVGTAKNLLVTASGSNALTTARVFLPALTLSTSAGATTNAKVNHSSITLSGAGTATNASLFEGNFALSSSGGITVADYFLAQASGLTSTGTITTLSGFRAANLGHATLVGSVYGFNCGDFTGGATVSSAFASAMSSGTGKWGFDGSGTANNRFVGNTRIGGATAPTVALDVTGSAAVSGDTTLGSDSSDTLTVNAGTWTLGSNYVATRAAGALAGGTTILRDEVSTFSGDAGGATVARPHRLSVTASGTNSMSAVVPAQVVGVLSTSAGTTTTFAGQQTELTVAGAGAATIMAGYQSNLRLTSSGNVTLAEQFVAGAPTLSSTGAITTHTGFKANNLGHATLVTNALGFDHADFTAAATLTVGYRSLMSSGTGKWGFYASGTANNAFNGNTRIGSNVAPTETLHVTGTLATSDIAAIGTTTSATTNLNLPASTAGVSPLRIAHGSAPSAPVNGDIWTTTAGLFKRINGVTRGPEGYVLAASGAQVADKGNVTSEQTFVTVTVPANAMGANGMLRIWYAWNYTNSANDKTLRVRFSGAAGTQFHAYVATTSASDSAVVTIQNRNATNSQTGGPSTTAFGMGGGTTSMTTASVDTTAETTIVITGQKETGTETLTLERYIVEVLPSA
jgi:hypothetical protein